MEEFGGATQRVDPGNPNITSFEMEQFCHFMANRAGWWMNAQTGEDLRVDQNFNIPEKLMLIVSEIAEGMEGVRKDLMDDKLPHREMLEVELADAVIRIFDLAGALGYNVTEAMWEKLEFNAQRADHKLEARQAEGGKKF
jgi:NTP pyrophosphatase (non-canonical NTP hydrolase)